MDPVDIERAQLPLNRATSMPAGFYTSAEVFAAERDSVLVPGWIFLARDDQVPAAGDYLTFDTVGGPVILVRDRAGVVRCFANACP
ncbi:MAG TPA: Rieske 2Fe-2S domain-containing protein, partial [Ilumatobacteraceae bacterium]